MRKRIMLAVMAWALAAPAGAIEPESGSSLGQLTAGRPAAAGVPSVPVPSADAEALKAVYDEYYSALAVFSDVAYRSVPGSPEYIEAAAYGSYVRARVERLAARLKHAVGSDLQARTSRGAAAVSWGVNNELEDAFGFGFNKAAHGDGRGVTVKRGYCQVNYVKNGVPYLVQFDGFLKKGEVILTFDDGPGPLTEEISAAMRSGKAPSLFFVLGSKLNGPGKARVKTAHNDGHAVGVHGYNHATEAGKPFTALTTQETLRQLGGVKRSIAEAGAAPAKFFRPPYGIISHEALAAIDSELGLVPVGWTIDTLDWSTKDPEELFRKTTEMLRERGKGIVLLLLHDIHPQSRTAAKRLVGWLAENGFKVVSPERLAEAYSR